MVSVRGNQTNNKVTASASTSTNNRAEVRPITINNQVEATNNLAKYYSEISQDWAVGEGLIQGIDYSSKTYALQAKESATEAKESMEITQGYMDNAISNIQTAETNALNNIVMQEESVLSGITTAEANALTNIETDLNNATNEIQNVANSSIEDINKTGLDTKVSKTGDTMTGTLNLADTDITGSGQLRITKNSSVIFRNDGENFYILLTDKDNPDGDYNDLRPFTINLEQGYVTTPNPDYADNNNKVATTNFVKHILANSGFGLADIVRGNDGYIDFAMGFKVRWGQVTFANGSHTASITFPQPFGTSSPKVVLLRKSGATTSSKSGEVWCRGTSTTSFDLYQEGTSAFSYMYIAIGY